MPRRLRDLQKVKNEVLLDKNWELVLSDSQIKSENKRCGQRYGEGS